ncbi:hypothetical protein [Labilibaculum sp.]|uniref:hypothetical protein n=1 Tax=Labilibaculum sp. TaxID=2060723 RepID=UPI0035686FD1
MITIRKTADHANELRKYVIENTRLGIPALFIEEALHGYQGKNQLHFLFHWDWEACGMLT